jgi:hypothetical protein
VLEGESGGSVVCGGCCFEVAASVPEPFGGSDGLGERIG